MNNKDFGMKLAEHIAGYFNAKQDENMVFIDFTETQLRYFEEIEHTDQFRGCNPKPPKIPSAYFIALLFTQKPVLPR